MWAGSLFESWLHTRFLRQENCNNIQWLLLHIEYYAGSGASLLGKASETSQGTQAQQKTAGRRRLGNGNNSQLILGQAAVREQVQGYNTTTPYAPFESASIPAKFVPSAVSASAT
jgi:hypothetical protein